MSTRIGSRLSDSNVLSRIKHTTSLRWVRLFAATALTQLAAANSLSAQTTVPIRELAPVEVRSRESFGSIFGARQLSGGKVLVNDALRKQLIVLDADFGARTVSIDSASASGQNYGPRASPLIPYLADSSLFVDGQSLTLLVIDPNGKVARVMSAPKPGDLTSLASSASGVDTKGNLVYRGRLNIGPTANGAGRGGLPNITVPDSAPVVRADFDTRRVDTLGNVKVQSGNRAVLTQDANGKMIAKTTINPLITVDEWAVLSDGTIAFVRGHDYHIDYLYPDGRKASTPKLPFDWKQLTDTDKQALIDSAKAVLDATVAQAKANAANPAAAERAATEALMSKMISMMSGSDMASVTVGGGRGGGGMTIGAGAPPAAGPPGLGALGMFMPTVVTEFVPLKEIADYYPAIRSGAAKPDLDGNLWILPTSSAQSKAGELVYDVVNNRGELSYRVRLPAGLSIAGFGKNGVVYLMQRETASGAWFLERTKVLNARATSVPDALRH